MLGPKFANPGSHRGLSRDLWKRVSPELAIGGSYDPSLGIHFSDDFETLPTGKYTVTQATAGTFSLTGADGGVAVANAGSSTADQGPNIQTVAGFLTWEVGARIVFEARIRPVTVGTAPNIFLGLSIIDTTIMSSGALTNSDYIGFKSLGASSAALKVTFERDTTAGSPQSAADITTLVDGTWTRLGFVVEPNGLAIPYVDGVEKPSYKLTGSTNMPAGVVLAPSLALTGEGSVQPTIQMDYWKVVKEFAYQAA